MKSKNIPTIVIIAVSIPVLVSMALAAQDRFTLKAPTGVAFSEFRGYETWLDVAVVIKAYNEGIPGNGKPFPEGSILCTQ